MRNRIIGIVTAVAFATLIGSWSSPADRASAAEAQPDPASRAPDSLVASVACDDGAGDCGWMYDFVKQVYSFLWLDHHCDCTPEAEEPESTWSFVGGPVAVLHAHSYVESGTAIGTHACCETVPEPGCDANQEPEGDFAAFAYLDDRAVRQVGAHPHAMQ